MKPRGSGMTHSFRSKFVAGSKKSHYVKAFYIDALVLLSIRSGVQFPSGSLLKPLVIIKYFTKNTCTYSTFSLHHTTAEFCGNPRIPVSVIRSRFVARTSKEAQRSHSPIQIIRRIFCSSGEDPPRQGVSIRKESGRRRWGAAFSMILSRHFYTAKVDSVRRGLG